MSSRRAERQRSTLLVFRELEILLLDVELVVHLLEHSFGSVDESMVLFGDVARVVRVLDLNLLALLLLGLEI